MASEGCRSAVADRCARFVLLFRYSSSVCCSCAEWVGTGYNQQKRVVNRARDFLAVIRRRRAKGWDAEEIAVFKLTIYGARDLNGNPPSRIPPIGALTVGSQPHTHTHTIAATQRCRNQASFSDDVFSLCFLLLRCLPFQRRTHSSPNR